jgi:hypothetical protein
VRRLAVLGSLVLAAVALAGLAGFMSLARFATTTMGGIMRSIRSWNMRASDRMR